MWHNHINYAPWVGIQLPFEGDVSEWQENHLPEVVAPAAGPSAYDVLTTSMFFHRSWSSWLYHLFFLHNTPMNFSVRPCHAPKHLVERHIFAFRQTFYPEFCTRLAPSNLHGTPKWDPEDNSSIGNSGFSLRGVHRRLFKHQLVSLPFFTSFLSQLAVSLHFMLFKIAQNWIWTRYPQNMTRSLKMIPWSYPKPPDLPS